MAGPPAANARPCKIRAKSAWAGWFVKNGAASPNSATLLHPAWRPLTFVILERRPSEAKDDVSGIHASADVERPDGAG
jgi:hypothetical protein